MSPSEADIAYYGEMLDYGTKTPDWLMQYFLESDEGDGKTQCIARLYQAFYRRLPDTSGFMYWMDARRSGKLERLPHRRAVLPGPRVRRDVRPLDNGGYVDLVYQNVLGRTPDAAGRQYWVDQLEAGVTRGKVMTGFSESPEYKAAQANKMDVVGCYGVMYNRVPNARARGVEDAPRRRRVVPGHDRHAPDGRRVRQRRRRQRPSWRGLSNVTGGLDGSLAIGSRTPSRCDDLPPDVRRSALGGPPGRLRGCRPWPLPPLRPPIPISSPRPSSWPGPRVTPPCAGSATPTWPSTARATARRSPRPTARPSA